MEALPNSAIENRKSPRAPSTGSSGQRGATRRTWKRDHYTTADLEDDMALAKSDPRVPYNGKSQNAAKAAATPARNSNVQTKSANEVAEKTQDAALYAAGVLYKGASPGDGQLTLDNIRHDEPTYKIRQAKPPARKHDSWVMINRGSA